MWVSVLLEVFAAFPYWCDQAAAYFPESVSFGKGSADPGAVLDVAGSELFVEAAKV
jgi:hypothetical protein